MKVRTVVLRKKHQQNVLVAAFVSGVSDHPALDALTSDELAGRDVESSKSVEPVLDDRLDVDDFPTRVGCRKHAQVLHRHRARLCPTELRRPAKSRMNWLFQLGEQATA